MKRVIFFLCCLFIMPGIFPLTASAQETSSYEVFFKTYKRNSIIVEFPQIKGLSDMKKQDEVNYLLEKEIFQYITDYYNEFLLNNGEKVTNILETISNTYDADLEFICHTGIENDDLLSIRYAVYGYGHGGAHPNTWGYAFTLDLEKLEIIQLGNLITIDDSFLDLKGAIIFDRDFSPLPYKTDAALYETLDSYKLYTRENIMSKLESNTYNRFYITKKNNISFFFGIQNHEQEIEIKMEDIKQYLNPIYLEKLILSR